MSFIVVAVKVVVLKCLYKIDLADLLMLQLCLRPPSELFYKCTHWSFLSLTLVDFECLFYLLTKENVLVSS